MFNKKQQQPALQIKTTGNLTGNYQLVPKQVEKDTLLVLQVQEDNGSYETCADHFQEGYRPNYQWRDAKLEDLVIAL